jgi:hypothetical protein
VGNKSAKGGEFERQFSRWLSLWLTRGQRRDLFWRSGGSGSVSTRTGQRAMAGDIMAVEEEGGELGGLITWELKNGYPNADMMKLLDGLKGGNEWLVMHDQAVAAWRKSGTATWAMVHHRPRKHALVTFPFAVARGFDRNADRMSYRVPTVAVDVVVYRLEDWFAANDPDNVLAWLRACRTGVASAS